MAQVFPETILHQALTHITHPEPINLFLISSINYHVVWHRQILQEPKYIHSHPQVRFAEEFADQQTACEVTSPLSCNVCR